MFCFTESEDKLSRVLLKAIKEDLNVDSPERVRYQYSYTLNINSINDVQNLKIFRQSKIDAVIKALTIMHMHIQ